MVLNPTGSLTEDQIAKAAEEDCVDKTEEFFKPDAYIGVLIFVLTSMIWQFCVAQLLISLVILKVKPSEDILQGISKLDYLLTISRFQQTTRANQFETMRPVFRLRIGSQKASKTRDQVSLVSRIEIAPSTKDQAITSELCHPIFLT